MNKNQLLRRLLVLCCLLLLCGGIGVGRLAQLQLADGESYVKQAAVFLTTTTTVSAARGEILDRYGRPMVTNGTTFSLVLIGSTWPSEGQYPRLLELANKVKADGGELQDVLPISDTAPYTYISGADSNALRTLSTYIKESADALDLTAVQQAKTDARAKQAESPRYDDDGDVIDEVEALDGTSLVSASEFLDAMRTYLEGRGMTADLSDADVRTLVGLYYSMRQAGFDTRANFTFATGISIDLISVIKENHKDYVGVEIETEAVRRYDTEDENGTTYAAHLLGTVGDMWAEEWTGTAHGGPYQTKSGYNLNDKIGKTGLELALEEYLHGTAGSSAVQTTLGGDALSEQTTGYAPEPGDNAILTIDLDLQKVAEDSLAENVSGYGMGGAAVALDVNSGEVLAMASYPSFSLSDYYDTATANARASDSRSVELNRATSGQYAPGSTFKVLTAIAALEEGVIDEHTSFTCTGEWEYGGTTFRCNNHEHPMTLDVTQAIKYSCNTFFYNVGKELTGAHLEKWCERFGLGQITGIEIGESAGHAAGPTYRTELIEQGLLQREWQGGDDVNAAIGQSDHAFTPLQLANYLAAVVNGGTLYQPTLIKTIKSYDYSEVVQEQQPVVLDTIEFSDHTRDLVMQGMAEVTAEGGTAATVFADYPIKVGGKTGTAEMYSNGVAYDNGLFIAFAPFDDPQIAVCVVGENAGHGSSVAPVVRDIFDAYFKNESEQSTAETVQRENALVS